MIVAFFSQQTNHTTTHHTAPTTTKNMTLRCHKELSRSKGRRLRDQQPITPRRFLHKDGIIYVIIHSCWWVVGKWREMKCTFSARPHQKGHRVYWWTSEMWIVNTCSVAIKKSKSSGKESRRNKKRNGRRNTQKTHIQQKKHVSPILLLAKWSGWIEWAKQKAV